MDRGAWQATVHGNTVGHDSTCRHKNVSEIIQGKKKKQTNTGRGREALCLVKSAILKLLSERII